jgi:hypothetical protein
VESDFALNLMIWGMFPSEKWHSLFRNMLREPAGNKVRQPVAPPALPALGRAAARWLDASTEMVKIMTGNKRRSAMIGNNATVLPLRNQRSARRTLYFTRSELNQLLGLYSRNVARGIWRDYAIDHRDGQALFSVFRHTQECAVYTIVKSVGPGAVHGAGSTPGQSEFAVLSGRQRLRAACSLAEALEYFRSRLAAVPSGPT